MIAYTEDEAATKWCPWARVAVIPNGGIDIRDHDGLAAVNRDSRSAGYDPTIATRCLGSGCMAWHWLDPPYAPQEMPPPLIERIEGYPTSKNTFDEASRAQRPAHVPPSWEVFDRHDGYFYWLEPMAERAKRQQQLVADWPKLRKGACGLAGREHPL